MDDPFSSLTNLNHYPRLSPCETCGKEISTNLYRGEPSDYRQDTTVPQGCPNCGELNPHREILTEEIKKLLGELHYVRPYGVKGLDGILSELDSPIEEPPPKQKLWRLDWKQTVVIIIFIGIPTIFLSFFLIHLF